MDSPTGTTPPQDLRKAVRIMVTGIALFSVLNAVVKDQVALFPANQVTFFRNAFGLPALLAILFATGNAHRLGTRHLGRHISHAATMTVSLCLAFIGFRMIPLAEATAISFIRPLIVTALAAPLLGERVTRLSWIAVLVGFAGVLVVAQPGGDALVLAGAAYSIAASLVGALNLLQQRRLSLTDHTLGIATWFMLLSSAMLLPTLFFSWVTPSPGQLAGLIGMGLASGVCQYIIMRPFAFAGAAALAPVQYTGLLWSLVLDLVWFGHLPTTTVLIGSAIIVAATMLVLRGGPPAKGR